MLNFNSPKKKRKFSFITHKGTILEDFTSTNGWSNLYNSTFSLVDPPDKAEFGGIKRSGQCLQAQAITAGTSHRIEKTVSWNLTSSTNIYFSFYIGDLTEFVSGAVGISIKLSSTTDYSSCYSLDVWGDQNWYNTRLEQGWNTFIIPKADFTVTGSPNWGSIIRLRVGCGPRDGTKTAPIIMDEVRKDVMCRPVILLSIDDGYASDYNYRNLWLNKGINLTHFLRTNEIGNTDRLTIANCQDLQGYGDCMANHTNDHTNLTTLDTANIINRVNTATSFLVSNGLSGWEYLAYPYGAYNPGTVIPAVKQAGIKIARAVHGVGPPSVLETPVYDSLYNIRSYELGPTTNATTVNGYIDQCISKMALFSIHWHKIVTGTPTGYEVQDTVLDSILSYIKTKMDAGQLFVMTYEQFRKAIGNK
jgi:hypothetical protein